MIFGFKIYYEIKLIYFFSKLDNRPLPINRKQKVFPNGTLIIENVERNSDQAVYTCVAKNAEGYSARGNLEVEVMGKSSVFISKTMSLQICENSQEESNF